MTREAPNKKYTKLNFSQINVSTISSANFCLFSLHISCAFNLATLLFRCSLQLLCLNALIYQVKTKTTCNCWGLQLQVSSVSWLWSPLCLCWRHYHSNLGHRDRGEETLTEETKKWKRDNDRANGERICLSLASSLATAFLYKRLQDKQRWTFCCWISINTSLL